MLAPHEHTMEVDHAMSMDSGSPRRSVRGKRLRSPSSSPGAAERPLKRPTTARSRILRAPRCEDWVCRTQDLSIDRNCRDERAAAVADAEDFDGMTIDDEELCVETATPCPPCPPPNTPLQFSNEHSHPAQPYLATPIPVPIPISSPTPIPALSSVFSDLQAHPHFNAHTYSLSHPHSHSHPQSQYPTPPLSPMFPSPSAHLAQPQQTQQILQHQGLFSMQDATESSSASPADPVVAATSPDLSRPPLSPRKPRFTMGPRADCEKCRRREPGHWVHLD